MHDKTHDISHGWIIVAYIGETSPILCTIDAQRGVNPGLRGSTFYIKAELIHEPVSCIRKANLIILPNLEPGSPTLKLEPVPC